MIPRPCADRYDVVIAGARVAGASTAMLLARAGLRVLLVDPVPPGRDALSTHALMRGGVLQLHRWGLLDPLRDAGTPVIRSTTFHYGQEHIRVPIKPRDGVLGLYAPRRTLLDAVLVDASRAAGAEVVHGMALTGLVHDAAGRVRGAEITSRSLGTRVIHADLVIGADGRRSRVADLVGAEAILTVPHATASAYAYWPGSENDGYHWHYRPASAMGVIPTNAGESCVFISMAPRRFAVERGMGLESLYHRAVSEIAPELAERMAESGLAPKVRGFAGAPSHLRQAVGPGWALVGDAGYFKDPLTAHGITDALRDAELLSRAVLRGTPDALDAYQATRDSLSKNLLEVTGRIASLEWSMDELKELHIALSRAMNAEVDAIRGWSLARPAA